VAFLIERYGLPAFRRLYDTGQYEIVYAKSFSSLESEWRSSLQQK
jgi:hypothetical protein